MPCFSTPTIQYHTLDGHVSDDSISAPHKTHSNEGKEDFKNRVNECVTYADILREFPSAHPPIDQLIATLVPPIKPRHYSIASSMKMHPDSVHLLVVVHDWTTPKGVYKVGRTGPFPFCAPIL